MTSKSLRDIEQLKQQLNELAETARASDEQIIQVINAQAQHIQKLTAIVVGMHRQLHPEQYGPDGLPLSQERNINDAQHSSLIITP